MKLRHVICGALATAAVASGSHAAGIPNGDFSQGDTGFTSSYTSEAYAPGALVPEGTYTVGPNPQYVNSSWIQQSGDNNLLLVNGATNASQDFVYTSDKTSLNAGTYTFSADAANVCCRTSFTSPNAPSTLTFTYSLDGGATFKDFTPAGVYTTTPTSSDAGLQFSQLNFAFTNPTTTDGFEIRITNSDDAASGNDFAIDNLAISAAPEPGEWALMLGGVAALGLVLRAVRRRETEGLLA